MVAPLRLLQMPGEKARCELHKNAACCFEQNSGCMSTYFPSCKLSKWDKQDILGTAKEVKIEL